MDPRISRWAKTLVNYCLEVQPSHLVYILAEPVAEPLVAEVYRETLRAGGHPVVQLQMPRLNEIALDEASDDQLAWVNPTDRLMIEQANARLFIESETNTRRLANVDPQRQGVAARAQRELGKIRSQRMANDTIHSCLTLYPTAAYAQDADMSLADFEEFVFGACFLNDDDPAERWRDLGRSQQFYVDWLRDKDRVHVVGPNTNLHLSIAGRTFRNSDGKRNFPSGEFFTGPVEDSAEGSIRFTIPSVVRGHGMQDIRLTFEHGKVVEATAAQGQTFLDAQLELDAGARFLGEFAFGNNFGITRGIRNILYDEKIGGTIHMALGNSYPETGGKNTSALHWDMICDLRAAAGGGEVWVDDTLFLKDGKLMLKPGKLSSIAHRNCFSRSHERREVYILTDTSEYLTALARRCAAVFVAQTHPQAILLTGSTTEGTSDHYSDLDVILYYDAIPSDEALAAAQAELGGSERILFGPRTETDIGEQYVVAGVACQFAHTTIASWEDEMASVLERLDVASPIQKALSGMFDVLPLHGDEYIVRWQARARAYPDALARAMVEHYGKLYPIWYLAPRLGVRDATIWLVDSFVESSRNLLGVLAGLNRVYFTTFQFKRMRRFIDQLAIAPENLADRIERLFAGDHVAAVAELEALVRETVALVALHMPEATIAVDKLRLGERVQPWQPRA